MKAKHAKHAAVILIPLLLSSCSSHNKSLDQQTSPTINYSPSNEAMSYYESAIAELEESIINLKTDFYITEQKYKETIKNLEDKLSTEESTTSSSSSPLENISYSPFSYVVSNGIATITSYSGLSESITVPSNIGNVQIKKIGEYAFPSNVRSIIICDGITEIDWFAFSSCKNLEEIYIPSSVSLIRYGAFDGCPGSLVIKCEKNSYAEAYAKSFALNYIAE